MKKLLGVLFLVLYTWQPLLADTMQIKLTTPFRLNPIMGINGDDYEASSKFVQRLIFSPLVFPLEDPYLQDDYSIALDISLIESLEYRSNANEWANYELRNYGAPQNPVSRFFRIKLRNGLNFHKAGQRKAYDNLIADDVVYSYRVSRITMDRAYQNYLDKGGRLGINTLLYSKIKSFDDVYGESSSPLNVIFEMDSNVSCEDFLKLLVYVPILSTKQVNNENLKHERDSTEYKSLHNSLNMAFLTNTMQINNAVYDFYDFNKIPRNVLASFYRQPIGYGQFLIDGKPQSFGGGSGDPDLWKRINFTKNTEWCNFSSVSPVKRIGGYSINHDRYRSSSDKIIIENTGDTDTLARINRLKGNEVLYNIPLSASLFTGDSLAIKSVTTEKRKMQISHFLYGIFFGPSIHDSSVSMFKDARGFFYTLADRIRIENIVRYMSGDLDYSRFDSEISQTSGSLLFDLELQRLYYPFYRNRKIGEQSAGRSEIDRYYTMLEENDSFYQIYKSLLYDMELTEYYLSLGENFQSRKDFYDSYVGGTEYPEEVQAKINEQFRIARNYLVLNNHVGIDIFFIEGDAIAKTIAVHYRAVLDQFFADQKEEAQKDGKDWVVPSISQPKGIRNSEWKTEAVKSSNNKKLSLLIKGWNYRFDLLDELKNQFVDKQAFNSVEMQYKELIKSSALSAETMYYRIALPFVENAIMIPLLGIQNYAVYQKGKFPAFDEYKDIEILLLPYYWSDN